MNNKQIYKSLIFGITIVILLTQNAFTQHSLRMVKVHNDEIGTQTELIGALFGTFNLINTENPVGSFLVLIQEVLKQFLQITMVICTELKLQPNT